MAAALLLRMGCSCRFPVNLDPRRIKVKNYYEAKPVNTFKRRFDMADDRNDTCAHNVCTCPPAQDSKYCSADCENAESLNLAEISCSCNHPGCGTNI